jgi:hypothetical protein
MVQFHPSPHLFKCLLHRLLSTLSAIDRGSGEFDDSTSTSEWDVGNHLYTAVALPLGITYTGVLVEAGWNLVE